jgi:hypothetical protein
VLVDHPAPTEDAKAEKEGECDAGRNLKYEFHASNILTGSVFLRQEHGGG